MEKYKDDLAAIGLAVLVAIISQFGRILGDNKPLSMRRVLAGLIGAAMAAFVVSELMFVYLPDSSLHLRLAVAGIVGWIGGDVMTMLFEWYVKRNTKT
jgi:uncharacterized BrkB/YihY/UPF0761 family membrane protein